MPARLIINADDFGLTPGINRAIVELHSAVAVTSATLMATGPAFDDAVTLARATPTLGIGCHIVLTDGTPVSDPTSIPSLCPNGRTFRPSLLAFARDLLLHRITSADIARETLAQVQKLQSAGIHVTHLDTHKHTHIFPAVASQLASIVRRADFIALRNPFEPGFTRHTAHASLKRRLQLAALATFRPAYNRATRGTLTTDGTFGIAATGNLSPATLSGILQSIPATGTYELLCHPGHNDAALEALPTRLRAHRELEYQTLLEQIPQLLTRPNAPHLIHYAEL